MTIETLLLRGLFGACTLICGLTLAAMLTARPASSAAPAGHHIATAVTAHAWTDRTRTAG